MSISKTGMIELEVPLETIGERVKQFKANILASLEAKDIKGLSEYHRTYANEFRTLGGLRTLKHLVDNETIKYASTGKMRLYKTLFTRTEPTHKPQAFARYLREVISDEYKNEWEDILNSDESFVVVNPNQRAKHTALVFSMTVAMDRPMIRYLNAVCKNLSGMAVVNYYPVIIPLDNSEDNRKKTNPKGGFEIFQVEHFKGMTPEAYIALSEHFIDAMKDFLDKYATGTSGFHPYSADQCTMYIKRIFIDPNFKSRRGSISDILTEVGISTVAPASLVNRFHRAFQFFFDEFEQVIFMHRLTAAQKAAFLRDSRITNLANGTIPFTIALQVDVSATPLYNGSMDISTKSSSWDELIKNPDGSKPTTVGSGIRNFTGINLGEYVLNSSTPAGAPVTQFTRSVVALGTALERPTTAASQQEIFGAAAAKAVSSKKYADNLGKITKVFRTLMRKNLWLRMR